MQLVIGGNRFRFDDFGMAIDDHFIELYSAFLTNGIANWTDFNKASSEFFSAEPEALALHDQYFSNFTPIWNTFVASRDYDQAQAFWAMALEPVQKWEMKNPEKRIHKGTPYYFWGMTALLSGDLDKGYAMMHQALDEDIQSGGKINPRSPAYLFAIMDYSNPNQAFLPWLVKQMRYVDERQNAYSRDYSSKFKTDDLRTKFLISHPNLETVFIFAFTVARLMQLSDVPSYMLTNKFASQIQTNLFFDLIKVIDAAIHEKNSQQDSYSQHAAFLLNSIGAQMTQNDLGEVNGAKAKDFNKTIDDLLNGTFSLPNGNVLSRPESDVSISYAIRNHEAHLVTSEPIINSRFHEIEQSLFNVLYLAVEFLY